MWGSDNYVVGIYSAEHNWWFLMYDTTSGELINIIK